MSPQQLTHSEHGPTQLETLDAASSAAHAHQKAHQNFGAIFKTAVALIVAHMFVR